jgi:Na+/melibiose symporter-like transporter
VPSGAASLPAARLLAFSTLAMPLAAVEIPLSTYVPPLYASAFGFGLTTVGLVFLAARLWDALIDPTIGIWSDRTRTRFGRRRPWIAAGGAIFALGAVPVFLPPAWFGPAALSASLFILYLGYSMMATPFSAWAGELSSRYHERTRIATYQQSMTSLALLLALVLPSLVNGHFAARPRMQLAAMGAMVFALLIPCLTVGLNCVGEPAPTPGPRRTTGLWRGLGRAAGNRLLLRVLAANFAVRLAQGIRTSLFVFFIAHFMGIPQWAPQLFLLQFVFGVAAGPIWLSIGRRLGKTRAAVAGELAQVALNLGLLFLSPSNPALLIFLTVAQGLAQGSGNLMLRAMVADVADDHLLRDGEERIGLFFSVFSLSDKAAFAVAIGVALPLVAWLGFDPRAANPRSVLDHLQIVFAAGPALAHALAAALIHGFPLDEARQADIRRKLDEHGREFADPFPPNPTEVR